MVRGDSGRRQGEVRKAEFPREVNYQRDHHWWGKHLSWGIMELWRGAQAELGRAMGAA